MALTTQQQNFISDLITLAGQITGLPSRPGVPAQLGIEPNIDLLVAQWNLNSMSGSMSDGDIQAVFPQLSATKVSNAVTAIEAVQTALGDKSSGQQVNLIKMQG
jgi:hypothetical protein